MNHSTDIRARLHDLELMLIELSLWEESPPDPDKLASTSPFAVDVLTPQQWLQWIFIPKMHTAIETGTLPKGFAITPYFATCWQEEVHLQPVISLLERIDRICQ